MNYCIRHLHFDFAAQHTIENYFHGTVWSTPNIQYLNIKDLSVILPINSNYLSSLVSHFRVLGGLIAAHLLIIDPSQPFGRLKPVDYDDGLLKLAHDLINRLLPAFNNTKTGVPWPRVM